jgi:hypothetical protein
MIHIHIILPCLPRSSEWLFRAAFPIQILTGVAISSIRVLHPANLIKYLYAYKIYMCIYLISVHFYYLAAELRKVMLFVNTVLPILKTNSCCIHACVHVCTYVCMCVCVCVCVCTYACMYVCTHVCMCLCVCMYVCMHVRIYVRNVCMRVCMYVCMYLRVYVCLYVGMYIYMYV